MLYFWSSFSPWNLEWMYQLYLFHLIYLYLLAYCSVLSLHGFSVSWLLSILLCFPNKYGSQNVLSWQTNWLVSRSLHMKSDNRDIFTLICLILTPNSPHSHPYSPHSQHDFPDSHHFYPDSPHSYPDSSHSYHCPHPLSQFSILAFTDSQTFMIKCSKLFVRRAANQIGNNTIGKNIVEYIVLL